MVRPAVGRDIGMVGDHAIRYSEKHNRVIDTCRYKRRRTEGSNLACGANLCWADVHALERKGSKEACGGGSQP